MAEQLISSRRNFVAAGAALVALPLTTRADLADTATNGAKGAPSRSFALQDLEDWTGQIGWRFAVTGEQGRVPMRLVAVHRAAPNARLPAGLSRVNSFIATFETDAERGPLGDRIYKVQHPALGTVGLFLQRGDVRDGTARLSAAFA